MSNALAGLDQFMDVGGPVLWVIAASCALLAALIMERYWMLLAVFPRDMADTLARWQARHEHRSWRAHRIRECLVANARIRLTGTLPLIKTLIALCPLLGLLGTVTGMMAVFDVIAMRGTGNVRAMAAGISRATLPTMAGMVVALIGLYGVSVLQGQMDRRIAQLTDRLTTT